MSEPINEFDLKDFAKELTDVVRRTTYMECAQIVIAAGCPISIAYLLIEKAGQPELSQSVEKLTTAMRGMVN